MGSGLHEQKFKEYWHGNIAWFDDAEKFDDSDGEVVYSIQKGNEGDHYSYQWTGYFCPIRLGTYSFKLMSDDGGAILTINGQEVLKGGYWGFEVATYEATDLQCVPANIYYGQYSGDARCSFEFELPNDSDSKIDFGAIFFSLKECTAGSACDVDCVGSWGTCDADCRRVYSISQPGWGNGVECEVRTFKNTFLI